MKRTFQLMCCGILTLSLAVGLGGCQSYGGAAGAGAGIGAVAGGIIGHQSGNALEGAAIGAAIGAAGGAIAHDIKVRRMRSAEETAVHYNYQPEQGLALNSENTQVFPSTARPGQLVEASIEYGILGSQQGVTIQESRILYRGERLIAKISDKRFTRTDGTWVSTLPFELPTDLAPGIYTVIQVVNAGGLEVSGSNDINVSNF